MPFIPRDANNDSGFGMSIHDLELDSVMEESWSQDPFLTATYAGSVSSLPVRRPWRAPLAPAARRSAPHLLCPYRIAAPPRAYELGTKLDILSLLPYELVLVILSYLDNRSLIMTSYVCKLWHRFMQDPSLWRQKMIEQGWINHLSKNLVFNDPTLDWYYMYKQKYQLERRWVMGRVITHSLIGHNGSIYCVQFDDAKIVTGSRDRTIKFWNLATYQCEHTLRGHEGSVLCLQYNKDILVSGSSDTTVMVWNMHTKQPSMVLRGHTGRITKVCFDDRYIVSSSKDATVRIWDIVTGQPVRVLSGHYGPINGVQLHGKIVVSASSDTSIRMWDIDTGVCIRELYGHTLGVACIQYNGKHILSGSNDQTVKVWDAETGHCLTTCYGHLGLVRTIHWDGDRIVSAGYDKSIRVWSPRTGECLLHFQSSHAGRVYDVQFDHKRIVSVGPDQTILVMDFAHGLDTRFMA